MALITGAFIVVMSFLTAALSGVFGMAGGLLLKGALALVLPVSATFVAHGILQLVANGWRAILHRRHVRLEDRRRLRPGLLRRRPAMWP